MPKGRRFVSRKSNGGTGAVLDQEIHYCVVCYNAFYQFNSAAPKWESSISKVFYKALNIPPISTGVGDDDDEEAILSLPYCPECHTKISVMYSLYSQLELIQNQYATLRNEIAFIVVETIEKNSKNGPMDFIRHQIYEKWKEYHAEESAREDYRESLGLDALMTGNIAGMSEIAFEEEELGSIKLEDIDFSNFTERKMDSNPMPPLIGCPDFALSTEREDESFNGVPVVLQENRMDNHSQLETSDRFVDSESLPLSGMEDDLHSQVLEPRIDTTTVSSEFPTSPSTRTSPTAAGRARTRGGYRARRGRQVNLQRSQPREIHVPINNGTHHEIPENEEVPADNQLVFRKPKRGRGVARRGRGSRSRQSARNVRSPIKDVANPTTEQERMEIEDVVSIPSFNPEPAEPAVLVDGFYQCKLCPKAFTDKSRLVGHESSFHPSLRSLRCQVCGKGFSSTITYRRHMAKLHAGVPIVVQSYPCNLCKRTFKKATTLLIHKKTHNKERPKVSPLKKGPIRPRKKKVDRILNGGNVTHSVAVDGNEESVSPRPNVEKLKCNICNKAFPYLQLLNMHFLTHAKKKRTENAQLNMGDGDFTSDDDNRVKRTHSLSPANDSFVGSDSDSSQLQTQQRSSLSHTSAAGMPESL